MKDHTEPTKPKTLEGPAGYCPFKPEGAEKMPVKDYPASSKIPYGPKTKIEGPCSEHKGYK